VELPGSVVVLTGASSGIGRAAAREFARRGARLVLGARRGDALQDVAAECAALGGEAIAVPTDVSDEAQVQALAARAVERFGVIDAWVNNASVYMVGRFEDTPPDAFRRLIDVNLFGSVHGARAALPHFRERGRGVLVFTTSIDAHLPAPLVSAYAASKWAVYGFAESPAAIDTPLFHHAANYSGRRLKAISPTYEPEKVARAIRRQVERPRREVIVGGAGKLAAAQRRLSPALTDAAFSFLTKRDHFAEGEAPPSAGNLWEPVVEGTAASGGWQTVPRGARRIVLVGAATVPAALAARRFRR
jgi:NAD(P)-dependent dehydrogenase (short-subunit alcohol dehydrogenase family)